MPGRSQANARSEDVKKHREAEDRSGSEDEVSNDSQSDFDSESENEEAASNPRHKQGNHKTFSAAEVRAAREASETFRSNVFKLQVDEVLKEISIDEKYASQARKLLFALREKISETRAMGPLSYSDVQKTLTTRVPFPTEATEKIHSKSDIKYKFGYIPPSIDSINVIGSWSLHTTVRRPSRTAGIDLLVPMADELFENKDYLDFRYHRKRAFFLAALASQLAEAGLPVEPRFERFNGHPLKPTLQLVATDSLAKLGKRITIYIHVSPASSINTFPTSKLGPSRNADRSVEGPTPIYNWSVLSDLCAMPLLRYLHATAATTPAFGDAVRLGMLWLQQRRWGSDPMKGGFGALEFTVLLAALLNGGAANGKKRLLSGYSSYQLFKGVLLYIAESEHIALEGNLTEQTGHPTTISKNPGLLFTDCGLDVLANLAPWAPRLLRHDAQLAVDMLNDGTCDRFDSLFLRDCGDPTLRFDFKFEIELAHVQNTFDSVKEIHSILHKAWGSRYRAMMITPVDLSVQGSLQSSWSLASDTPAYLEKRYMVGVVLDPQNAEKRVTFVGDEMDNDANAFKAFWGQKSSLRRFQDGSIKEAVVWSHGLRPIVQDAAVYALTSHMDAELILPQLLERKLLSANGGNAPEKPGSSFLALNSSFQKLGQILQDLRGELPLRILSLYGTSAELRSASIVEPTPFDPSCVAEGLIEMETSSRWPSDLEAAEKVKSAFLIKIAETLRQNHPQYYPVIGLEPAAADPTVEAAFATIQTPEGFYFKLRISARTPRSTATVFNNLADHTRLVSTMVNRYPGVLSTAIRLVKYWLESQMLMTYVSEPAAELLTIHVFANSAPWAPPVTATTAFWRVINLVARWDWRETNIWIDVDRHIDSEEHHIDNNQLVTGCDMDFTLFQSMAAAFTKQRKQDPALTEAPWAISTKLDLPGVMWTSWQPRSRVAPVIASRVTTLARAAKPGMNLFEASLGDFDVAWTVTVPSTSISKNKNLVVSDPHKAIIGAHDVGIDLVQALTKLYKDALVLFYSGSLKSQKGKKNVLCGIWNRQALDPIPKMRPTISYPLKQTKMGFELDKGSVISEIERLGSGILERIN